MPRHFNTCPQLSGALWGGCGEVSHFSLEMSFGTLGSPHFQLTPSALCKKHNLWSFGFSSCIMSAPGYHDFILPDKLIPLDHCKKHKLSLPQVAFGHDVTFAEKQLRHKVGTVPTELTQFSVSVNSALGSTAVSFKHILKNRLHVCMHFNQYAFTAAMNDKKHSSTLGVITTHNNPMGILLFYLIRFLESYIQIKLC